MLVEKSTVAGVWLHSSSSSSVIVVVVVLVCVFLCSPAAGKRSRSMQNRRYTNARRSP